MSKIATWFESWDIFGHPIGVNYHGKDTYQTKLGAFCTFVYYALSLFNLSMLIIAFKGSTRMEMDVQKNSFEPFQEPPFYLTEHQTTVYVLPSSQIPANIGRFRLFQNKNCYLYGGLLAHECEKSGHFVEVKEQKCSSDWTKYLAEFLEPRYGFELA